MRALPSRSLLVLLTTAILVAGCGTAAPRTAPTQTPASTVPSIAPSPLPASSLLPTPTQTPGDPILGQLMVTVSADVRVRSQPWVGDDSVKYGPLLPIYSELRVLDGPVAGSGYVWYQVEPLAFRLDDGPGYGWVATAGKDGEPWIGPKPAAGPVPPRPTGAAFAEAGESSPSDEELVTFTQTASWRAPRTPGLMIRVYGVTECLARPANPALDTGGPCLLEDTPLPASALRLLATAPASDGVVSWTWTEQVGCESAPFMAKPGGLWYEAVVLAAYSASGHSDFAIAEAGGWHYSPGDMVC